MGVITMKRKVSYQKIEQLIIDIYNNNEAKNLFIESLKHQKKYKGYDYNNIMTYIFKCLDKIINKITTNQPITEFEHEFAEDAFIMLSNIVPLRQKDKNLVVLMNNYFTKFPKENTNSPKECNLTFLNLITTIITSGKINNICVKLSSKKESTDTGEIYGLANSDINSCEINLYNINNETFENKEKYYTTIYVFLHEFAHALQYHKRTFFSSHKHQLFEIESRLLNEDYDTYMKYYDGLEMEYEANCIAKELIDVLFTKNKDALEITGQLFDEEKKAYEENIDEFLNYVKRTYCLKLKRD